MGKGTHGPCSQASSNAFREEEKQRLAAFEVLLPPRSLSSSSHPLTGRRACLPSQQNIGSIVWELGTKALPTGQGESRLEGYSQLPGHPGQIKHMPWA